MVENSNELHDLDNDPLAAPAIRIGLREATGVDRPRPAYHPGNRPLREQAQSNNAVDDASGASSTG